MSTRQRPTLSYGTPVPAFSVLIAVLCMGIAAAGPARSSTTGSRHTAGPGVANHPVAVVPSDMVTVPESWPLNEQGAITCLTCHTKIPGEADGSRPMLRDLEPTMGPPAAFCAKCHDFDQRDAKSVHWLALGSAHVRPERAGWHDNNGTFDAQTRQCLSCHDGAMASESTNTTPWSRVRGYTGDAGRNHPVGVRYTGVSRPGHLSPLRPSSLLPREVPLIGGKVGCTSCHNLYAGSRHLLTVPIRGSQLCLTCHAMS